MYGRSLKLQRGVVNVFMYSVLTVENVKMLEFTDSCTRETVTFRLPLPLDLQYRTPINNINKKQES